MAKPPALLRSIGPALIVASIVLGPGSILTSSKVGCQYGYAMLWVLGAAVLLMVGMTALAASLGVLYERTPCGELARRAGRPTAAAVGLVVFVIIACFQSSNNAAVVASLEGLMAGGLTSTAKVAALVLLNAVVMAALFGYRGLYRPLERFMIVLVLAMLIAFGVNLLFARPSPTGILGGLVPRVPSAPSTDTVQQQSVWALMGLVATTFSIAGAFYQAYLVREKGWSAAEARKGLVDAATGIAVLGIVSAMIMITSAAALHGRVPIEELNSTTDIARQLEPLFGPAATWLFSLGIFAAAFSSFLGNALVGGTVLADGLGLGSSMDDLWPRRLTVLALLTGMGVATFATLSGNNPVQVIVLAQALTVLGGPALAVLMFWLCVRRGAEGQAIPRWCAVVAGCGVLVTLLLAARTTLQLIDAP